MTELILAKTRIADGVWEGRLQDPDAGPDSPVPAIRITLGDQTLTGAEIEPVEDTVGVYILRLPIPDAALSEGLHTFHIINDHTGHFLGNFTIALGLPLESDVRAELNELRSELDLLKRAFRRHCVETT